MATEQTRYTTDGRQITVFPNGTFDEADTASGLVYGSGDWRDINDLDANGELMPELRDAWIAAGFTIPATVPER